MAIHYGHENITITDDFDPSRPAIVLPLGTSSDDVASAALGYLHPEPDFDGFGESLLTSVEIREAYDLALAGNAITTCSLPGAILAAEAGEIGHLRTAISLLRNQGLLSNEVLLAMEQAAEAHHLPQEFLQVFQVPQ
jgi:hypothetical protein